MPHVLDASKFCITWQGGWGAHLRFDLKATLQFAASFHGFQHGDLVGILDVAAHRNAHGDSRHPESRTLQLLREIDSGGLALDSGISGDNHFLNLPTLYAPRQVGNTQLFGTNTVQRRNRSVEHVVNTVK